MQNTDRSIFCIFVIYCTPGPHSGTGFADSDVTVVLFFASGSPAPGGSPLTGSGSARPGSTASGSHGHGIIIQVAFASRLTGTGSMTFCSRHRDGPGRAARAHWQARPGRSGSDWQAELAQLFEVQCCGITVTQAVTCNRRYQNHDSLLILPVPVRVNGLLRQLQ
jgi:hypothetical protein